MWFCSWLLWLWPSVLTGAICSSVWSSQKTVERIAALSKGMMGNSVSCFICCSICSIENIVPNRCGEKGVELKVEALNFSSPSIFQSSPVVFGSDWKNKIEGTSSLIKRSQLRWFWIWLGSYWALLFGGVLGMYLLVGLHSRSNLGMPWDPRGGVEILPAKHLFENK